MMGFFLFLDIYMKLGAGLLAWGVTAMAVIGLFRASYAVKNCYTNGLTADNATQMWLSVIAAAAVGGLLLALSAT